MDKLNKKYKPDGYNSVSPYFVVDGAQMLIDKIKQVFDIKELRRYDLPNGKIMHAELKIDDSVIMLGDSAEGHPPNKLTLHIYVPDVHATFKKAVNAGFHPVESPVQKPGDTDIRCLLKDFQGNFWALATQQQE